VRVDEHEEGPSAMMRKADRDRDRDERRGDRRRDRDDDGGDRPRPRRDDADTAIEE
jgi:small subunit ribosomal protein S6